MRVFWRDRRETYVSLSLRNTWVAFISARFFLIIDAVFTWVDGDDPEFLKSRQSYAGFNPPSPMQRWRELSSYSGANELLENPKPGEHAKSRFRNLEELRYAMRSVELYAPWINKIFLVTNGQVPYWLDTKCERVTLVDHKDIFQDPSHLPCFNSNAIELNLDNIVGLSEHFIYFNDDVFLGRPVNPSDFCDQYGRPIMFLEKMGDLPSRMSDRSQIGHSWAYNHQLVYAGTKRKKQRKMFAHTPQMYTKTLFREIKRAWPKEAALTVQHKFRTAFDFVMRVQASHLASNRKWSNSRGFDQPLTLRKKLDPLDYIFVRFGEKRSDFSADLSNVLSCRPKFFCINDEIDTGDSSQDEKLKGLMASTMLRRFPQAASFEREDASQSASVEEWRKVNQKHFEPVRLGWVRLQGHSAKECSAIQWRNSDADTWQSFSRKKGAVELGLWGEIRVLAANGEADQSLVLHLEAVEADSYRFPERGFPRPRRFDLMIDDVKHLMSYSVQDLLNVYRDVEEDVAFVRATADPILYTPNNWAISKLYAVDDALRNDRADERELALLDEALHSKIDPFWIAYRRVLCVIQMGKLDLIPETVRSGVLSDASPVQQFVQLASDLIAHAKNDAALRICEALTVGKKLNSEAVYLRSLCRWNLKIEDCDAVELLSLPRKSRSIHPGKCFDLWSKIALAQDMAPQTALFLLDQYAVGSKESSELFLARFRILSRLDCNYEARSAFMHAVHANPDVASLAEFAVEEHEAGNLAGAKIALDLLRAANPGTNPCEIPWAAAMVKTGRINSDATEILTSKYDRISDDKHFWTIFHVVRALVKMDAPQLCLICYQQMAAAGAGKIKDLIFLSKEAWANDNREMSLEMLHTLKEYHPHDPEALLNWAELSINAGNHSQPVQTALDDARQFASDNLWIVYHQCRLYRAQGRIELFDEALKGLEKSEKAVQALSTLAHDWRRDGDQDAGNALLASLGMD